MLILTVHRQIFPGVRSYLRDDGRGGKGLEPIPVHVSTSHSCPMPKVTLTTNAT